MDFYKKWYRLFYFLFEW